MAEFDDNSLVSTVVSEVSRCVFELGFLQNTTDCMNMTSQMNDTNVSNVVTSKPALMAHTCEEGPGYFRWLGDIVLLPPIVFIGIVGNVLAFATLCAQPGNLSTSILLRFIAVIDTLLLLVAIPLRFMRQLDVCHGIFHAYNDFYARNFTYLYAIVFVLRTASTWSTVLLTIDRHIAVCRPLHAHRIVTIRLAVTQVVGVAIGSILFNIPIFFEYHIANYNGYERVLVREYAKSDLYVIGYRVLAMLIVMYIVPMATLVFFNILLIRNLRVAAKDRKKMQADANDRGTTRSVTIIVVAVVVTFCICNVMPLTSHILYSMEKFYGYADTSQEKDLMTIRRYVSQMSNVFVSLNSAVNFLIYCVCCRSFRTTFNKTFCRRKTKSKSRTPTSRNSMTSQTYMTLSEHNNISGKQLAQAHNSLLIECKDTSV